MALKADYGKVDVAPPPYSVPPTATVHEHVDYSAGPAWQGREAAGNGAAAGPVAPYNVDFHPGHQPPQVAAVPLPAAQPYAVVQPYTAVQAYSAVSPSFDAASQRLPPPPPATASAPSLDQKEPPPVTAKGVLEQFGNMLFPVLGFGLMFSLLYTMLSLCLCVIIVGLPYARTLLRQAALCMQPYGTEVSARGIRYRKTPQGTVLNVLWAITFGLPFFLLHLTIGVCLMCTIFLIPFGVIHMRLGRRILWPVGAEEGLAVPDEAPAFTARADEKV